MKRRFLTLWVLVALVLACMAFSGCGFKNETLDGEARLLVSALNEGDEESFRALLYPGWEEQMDLHELFLQIKEHWVPLAPEDLQLSSFHVRASGNKSGHNKSIQGVYPLPGNEEYPAMLLVYSDTEEGKGLSSVYLLNEAPDAAAQEPQPVWRWLLSSLCIIIQILTVIDILVKKPRKYGWYIILALLFFTFTHRTDQFTIQFSIPWGAFLYWGMRNKLLREKERLAKEQTAISLPTPESVEDPQDDPDQSETSP